MRTRWPPATGQTWDLPVPRKELRHMPGSSTPPGQPSARDNALGRVAFRFRNRVGTRKLGFRGALEDKIVQGAACAVLNAIYEEDFLGFSYGFRPKRSQHDALDALMFGIYSTKVNY